MRIAFCCAAIALATAAPASADAWVEIYDWGYSWNEIEIDPGEAIHFTNYADTTHTVTSDDGLFDSGAIPPGGGYSMTFAVPGTHTFHSTANPGFAATIKVPLLGLPGEPADLANDRVPALPFPAPIAADVDVHPQLGVAASKTRLLIGWTPEATVEQANEALAAARVEIVGGLPATGILLGQVEESWCCWGEGDFGFGEGGWEEDGEVELSSYTNLENALETLRAMPGVDFAALDVAGPTRSAPRRANTKAESSGAGWDWDDAASAGNWWVPAARFDAAWNLLESVKRTGSTDIVTGIVDAGFEPHEDLPGLEIVTQICTSATSCVPVPNAPDEHGNHVAGTIGAAFDNADPSAPGRSVGVDGGNPVAKMKGYSADGFGVREDRLGGTLHVFDGQLQLFEALFRNPPPGLKILNYSAGVVGFTADDALYADAAGRPIWWQANPAPTCGPGANDDDLPEIAGETKEFCTPNNHDGWLHELGQIGRATARVAVLAADAGILLLPAAGNESNNFCPPAVPASTTGTCTMPIRGENIAEFGWVGANWDEVGDTRPNPILLVESADRSGLRSGFSNTGDIVAFGGDNVLSTVTGQNYDDLIGTSMAAPQVSAAAGFLLAQEPGLGLAELRERLLAWGAPHNEMGPHQHLFEWRVPDRLGHDRDGNRVIDYTPEHELVPTSFRVDLDACGTVADARSFVWTVDGAQIARTSSCRLSHDFPAEGSYSVGLTATAPGRLPETETRTVEVDDLLIVSIGDSIASGEGNPAVPKPGWLTAATWEDRRCHRSALAGPAKAARWLEAADVRSSVTLLHLACSGGRMTGDLDAFGNPLPGNAGVGGLLTPYEGIAPPDSTCENDRLHPTACLPPQLAEVKRRLGTRTPDALLISIGANDMQFSTIVKDCIIPFNDCSAVGNDGRDTFDGRIGLLAPRYDLLARRIALAFPDLPADRVFLTEYPDPTHDGTGAVDMSCLPVTQEEADWAATTVVTGLNAQVRAAAAAHGWTAVTGIGFDFALHGYCADESWFVRLTESFGSQGDPEGSFHPNGRGQNAYAERIVAAVRGKLGLTTVKPTLPVLDGTPRLDVFNAALVAPGALKALVDVNDPSDDGNRRIVYEPDGSGGMTETADEVESREPGMRTAPDGYVDMRDFRRFRDAWLQRCIEDDSDAACPANPVADTALDGADNHKKRDGNLDSCVWRTGDPDGCGASETDLSRFDFNGDGKLSVDETALVPLDEHGRPTADPAGATKHDDLSVLSSLWSLNPKASEGWRPEDLRDLLRSADVEVHADEVFADGAREADVQLRLKDGTEVGPLRRVRKTSPSIVMTIPVTAGDEFEVIAHATTPSGTTESVSEPFELVYGQDRRVDLCPGLTLKASPNRVPADGTSASIITATLHECRAGGNVAGLPISFSLAPATGAGSLDLVPSVTDAEGKAKARFVAGTTQTTVTVHAEVELPGGEKLKADVEIRTVEELTIKYIWRQYVEDWSESGSTRWATADPRQPDCTIAAVEYCIDSFTLALTSQTGDGIERHGTLTGGGNQFTLTEQILNSTTQSQASWTLSHVDGTVENGSRNSTWFVTDPQAYVDHELSDITADDEADAVRLAGMQAVGDLPYHYALLGSSGGTNPIEIGAAKNSLLLIPQGGAAPVRFAAHPERELVFPRQLDGTLAPYRSCFTLDEDLTPQPGYLVLDSTGGYVPGALSITRKPDYVAGDRPMPVGPAHLEVRYAFAAVAYYADSGLPAPTPTLPDCSVNNAPTAAFEFTPAAPDEGRQVAFRDLSTDLENDIKSWAWDFGDGKTATGPNPHHLFDDDGTYTVSLTVTDRDGLTGTTTKQVTVANLPPEASIDDAAAQEGQPLLVTYRVLDPGSVDKTQLRVRITSSNSTWAAQDDTVPANVHTLTITGLPAGTYPLRLTVSDKDGASAVADAIVSVTATPPPPPPPPPTTTFPSCNPLVLLDAEEQAFLDVVNDYRADNGLGPVAVSPALTRAAESHAQDMATHDYMEHTGRDGSNPAERAWREGYPKTASVGENLATGTSTGADALWAWRSSTTGHNENMLNPSWVAVGIARAQGSRWRWATSYGTQLDCAAPAAPAAAGGPEGAAEDEQPFAPTPTGGGAEPAAAEPVRVLGPGGESPVFEHAPIDATPAQVTGDVTLAEEPGAAAPLYPPTAAFTTSAVEPRENRPVTIANRSRDASGTPIAATFDPGDGSSELELAPDASVVHRFQQPYSISQRLHATDAAGRSAELERWTWVQPKPTPYLIWAGDNQAFTGRSAVLAADLIDPSDNAPVAGALITFTVDDTVVLTATTNAAGRASATLDLTGAEPGWRIVTFSFAGDDFLNDREGWSGLEVIRNAVPVAHAGGPYLTGEGGSLLLNGIRSRDEDDGIAAYDWDLDGDGEFDDATGRLPEILEWDRIATAICAGVCTPNHDYPIALRVTDTRGDSGTAATTVRFTPDFDILLGGQGKTIVPGQSNSFAVTLIGSSSWHEPVTLSVVGLPAGVSASFSENPITPTGVSVLTITGDAGLADGTFPIRVTATGGGVTKEVSDQVEVAFGLIPICYGSVHGVVTDKATGEPLGGALVRLDSFAQLTDASGRYVFENVTLGNNNAPRTAYLTSERGGYWTSDYATTQVACGALSRADLKQLAIGTGVISGTVVDKQTKQPIPGASINSYACNYWSCFWTPFAPLDENGAFTGEVQLGPQNTGTWFSLRADAPGYWYEDVSAYVTADDPGVTHAELIRKCTGTITTGRVTWKDNGEPAAGIGIGIFLSGGYSADLTLVTDANGVFRVDRTVELGYRNTPRHIGIQVGVSPPMTPHIVDPFELTSCDAVDSARIEIIRPVPNYGDVEGYVTDELTGEPLVDQYVTTGSRWAATDSTGHYTITGILLGYDGQRSNWVGVSATRSGYWDASGSALVSTDTPGRVDLKLLPKRTGSASGLVTDSVTGAPIPNATVSDGCWWYLDFLCAWTNREGRYSRNAIPLGNRNTPRAAWVTASADGYWPQAKWVSVSADTNTVTDFQLQPECAPAAVRGTVVNAETQAPLQGAQVSGASNYPAYTDANGRFEILNIRPATGNNPRQVWLTASAAGFYSQTKQITIFCGANITVTFGSRTSKTGTIVGRITDGDTGLPLANAFLGSDFGATATTDSNGEYRMVDAPLGDLNSDREWTLLAAPSGYKTQTRTVVVRADTESRLDFVFSSANQAPSANGQSVSLDEDTQLAIVTSGSDPDGDTLTQHVMRFPAHGTLQGRLPNVTYVPDANYSGPDSFDFVVNDGVASSERATVTIDVRGINDAPVALDDQLDASVDVPLRIPAAQLLVNDHDVDLDVLRISAVTLWNPGHGDVRLEGDDVVFTPPPGWENPYYYAFFTYTVTDDRGGYDTALVYVRVSEEPLAPLCPDARFDVEQDVRFSGTLACTDANGDALTYALVGGPDTGTLALRPDGTFDYDPAPGFLGTTTFTYRANDGALDSAVATATLVVGVGNEAPAATGDAYEVDEDTTLTLAAPGVLGNDTDPDGDALTAAVVAPPTHGTLTLATDGSLTYVPHADFHGADTFTYAASDGTLESAVANVAITVRPIDDAPVAAADAYGLDEDTVLEVAAPALLANDSDADGDALTAELVAGTSHGTAVLQPGGALRYTPNADFHGTDSFTYRARGAAAASDPATVTLTVRPVNDAPAVSDVTVGTDEDTAVAIDLSGSDVDGDTLSFTTTQPTHGTFANGTYTPDPDYHGVDEFTYTARDPEGAEATATVTIVVRPVNDAPRAADVAVTTDEDTPLAIALAGSDVDGDVLTLTATDPAHGTYTGGTYIPAANHHGDDTFTYTVADPDGETATATVFVTIRPVNDPPAAADVTVATDEDTPVTIDLAGTDLDGDALTLTTTAPAHGAYAGGTYTPAADYNGPDGFTYTVRDPDGAEATATVTIVVRPVADDPLPGDVAVTTPEDTAVAIDLTGTDPDGGTPTIVVSTSPAHGSYAGGTYTPDPNYYGDDAFTFTVTSESGASAVGTVSITVTPVNDAPTALDQSVLAEQDTPLAITLAGTDVDGDTLTYALESGPQHGSWDGAAYTPAAGYYGPDAFDFRVSDGHGGSDVGTVTIDVRRANEAPNLADLTVATDEDTPLPLALTGTDPDGDTLTITTNQPAHGTYAGGVYTPAENYHGPDSFSYTATDGWGGTATATVSITVRPVNDLPSVADLELATDEDTPLPIALSGSDADGDVLSFTHNDPAHGSFDGSAYTPAADYSGPDAFTYTAHDGNGGTATGTVTIDVRPVDDPPAAERLEVTTAEDTPLPIALSGSDPDGDALTITTTQPAHGSYADGTYTPDANYHGPDSFTYTVTAPDGASATATVAITVTPVNDDPVFVDQELVTDEDTPLPIEITAVDPDGDTLAYALATAPQHGSWDGSTYTPAPDFHGRDSFEYLVGDGHGGSDVGTVTITVRPVNDPPRVEDISVETVEGTPVSIDLTATDVDDAAPAIAASDPPHGSFAGGVYTPDPGFHGVDTFTYTATDDAGASATATVTVTVLPANRPPTVTLSGPAAVDEGAAAVTLTAAATDPDGDPLTYTWSAGTGVLSGSAATAGYRNDDGPRVDTVTVTVSDGKSSTTATAEIQVRNVAPTADAGPDRSGPWGLPVLLTGRATDPSAADTGAGLAPSWSFGDGATATGATASHAYAEPGAYTATLSARDKDGGTGTDTAAVAIGKRAAGIAYTGPATTVFGFTTLSARLADLADAPTARLAGRTVVFTIGGRSLTATTAADGAATVALAEPLLPGSHPVTVRFEEDTHYLGAGTTATVAVVSSGGKVTGGGLRSLDHPGKGGFNVHSATKGELQWQNGSVNFHAPEITALGVAPDGRTAWFAGIGKDGRPFVAYVEDNGEPGRNDVFKLWIAGVLHTPGNGRLAGGNIQIHKG